MCFSVTITIISEYWRKSVKEKLKEKLSLFLYIDLHNQDQEHIVEQDHSLVAKFMIKSSTHNEFLIKLDELFSAVPATCHYRISQCDN